MKIEKNFLVVSDYKWLPQNLEESWIHKYTNNYLIYDKYHRTEWEESDKIKKQNNVGQNVYDMFDFICTHYDNLPETTIFCRACIFFPKGNKPPISNGNCSEEKFINLMNNTIFTELHDFGPYVVDSNGNRVDPNVARITEDGGFEEINNSWYMHTDIPKKYFNNTNVFLHTMYVNPIIPSHLRFAPGCNYIIPKSNILKYSKKFYEQLREYVGWAKVNAESHMMERCLYTIFTCNFDVQDKYK